MAANSIIKVSSNWNHVGGCALLKCVQERAADPDFFVKPELNELVDEEKSILLSKEQSSECCELYVNLFNKNKIQAVSLVCNVIKIEIFQGHIKEYLQTIYGVIVDDLFKSYRYDLEVDKSGTTDLTFRFLTDSSEVCIFGIILYTAPNPNGITTCLPNSASVNVDSVKNILQNLTIQPNPLPNKFQNFLELLAKSNQYDSLAVNQHVKQEVNMHKEEHGGAAIRKTNEDIYLVLKSHIDERFQEMENRLQTYIYGKSGKAAKSKVRHDIKYVKEN